MFRSGNDHHDGSRVNGEAEGNSRLRNTVVEPDSAWIDEKRERTIVPSTLIEDRTPRSSRGRFDYHVRNWGDSGSEVFFGHDVFTVFANLMQKVRERVRIRRYQAGWHFRHCRRLGRERAFRQKRSAVTIGRDDTQVAKLPGKDSCVTVVSSRRLTSQPGLTKLAFLAD